MINRALVAIVMSIMVMVSTVHAGETKVNVDKFTGDKYQIYSHKGIKNFTKMGVMRINKDKFVVLMFSNDYPNITNLVWKEHKK